MIHLRPGLVLAFLPLAGCGANHGTELKFNNAQLFYTSSVDVADAERLGKYLQKTGFFDGRPMTAQLNKKNAAWEFRLVVQKHVAGDIGNVRRFRGMARKLSADVFEGRRVVVHLCDNRLQTLEVADPLDDDLLGL